MVNKYLVAFVYEKNYSSGMSRALLDIQHTYISNVKGIENYIQEFGQYNKVAIINIQILQKNSIKQHGFFTRLFLKYRTKKAYKKALDKEFNLW